MASDEVVEIGSGIEILNARSNDEESIVISRPKSFAEYHGQEELKGKLRVYVTACSQRNEALDHLLFFGPPGLGKTTIARVMAHELNVPIKVTSAPVLERSGDLVAILSNLQPREILFIDEIHRLPTIVEETLYSAMEEFCVDMIIGQGAGAQSMRLPLNPFTLIGATTKSSLISSPLRTRFGIIERLDFYSPEELAQIVIQTGKDCGITIDAAAALEVGKRARGTPRIVKRMTHRVRDYAQVKGIGVINAQIAQEALTFLGIDQDGLNKLDRDLLMSVLRDFDGGPVGLDTLAAITGEDKETIEEVCEPYLLRQGFLQKTPRGRQIPFQKRPYLMRRFFGMETDIQAQLFKS